MDTSPQIAAARPVAPSRGLWWVLKRAFIGLISMFAVTGLAAIIAQASIDEPVDELGIGAPAAALLDRAEITAGVGDPASTANSLEAR